MVIEKRKRSLTDTNATSKNQSSSNVKVKYNFDIHVLALFCSYVLSENKNIRRGQLVNLKNLMSIMDMSVYQADPERLKLIEFINRGLEARLKKDLRDKRLVLSYINGGITETDFEEDLDKFAELSDSEMTYINELVSGALKSLVVESNIDAMNEMIIRYKAQDYRYRDSMIDEVQRTLQSIHNKLRSVDQKASSESIFSLDSSNLKNQISDIYDKITSPNRFAQTQMQGLNLMLGGGLESTRFYLILGNSGVGKSLAILNMALQIKEQMRGKIVPKDPTKCPTIVFLTQENSMEETVDRLYTILSGKKMIDCDKQEVYETFKKHGIFKVDANSGEYDGEINIHIVYKPDRSIDTSDLYTIIEDIEDDGYEVIGLFQDHIKRIRSAERITDIRLELGAVVNEMKTVGILKDIFVVSVSHLNREGNKMIDENITANKFDLTRLLGRNNVGESLLMIDNSDAVIIIGKEFDQNKVEYLGMNLLKLRYAPEVLKFICYPWDEHNRLRLMTDIHLPVPIYKETLRPDNNMNNMVNGSLMKSSSYTNISALEEESNIFDSLTSVSEDYSSSTMTSIDNISENFSINVKCGNILEEKSDYKPIQLLERIA